MAASARTTWAYMSGAHVEVTLAPGRPLTSKCDPLPPSNEPSECSRCSQNSLKLDLQQCSGHRPPSAERSVALSKNVNVLGTPPSRQELFSLHAGFSGNPPSSRFLGSPWPRLVPGGQAPPPRFQDKHGGGEAVTAAAAELCQFCSLEDGEADIWFMVKWLSW